MLSLDLFTSLPYRCCESLDRATTFYAKYQLVFFLLIIPLFIILRRTNSQSIFYRAYAYRTERQGERATTLILHFDRTYNVSFTKIN